MHRWSLSVIGFLFSPARWESSSVGVSPQQEGKRIRDVGSRVSGCEADFS